MTHQYKITIDNDDGTVSEYFVDSDKPLGVQAGQSVDKFTALLGGVDIFDDVLTPNWYTEFICFIWAIARLNPEWEVGRLLGAGISTTKTLVGHGSVESSHFGGCMIDVRAAGIGSVLTLKGTALTFSAGPVLPTEWKSGENLAFVINQQFPDIRALYSNGYLFLKTRAAGQTNGTLAPFTVVVAGLAAPTRYGGDALAPGGQFNVEGSPAAPQAWVETQIKIVVGDTFFPDHESLKAGDVIRFTLAGVEYLSKISHVIISLPAIEIYLDTTNDYHDAAVGPLAHPIAVTLLDQVSIDYRRLPLLDDNPLFFMDEPVKEQTDRFIQEVYDYLKNNTFGVRVDQSWLKDQSRLDQLTEFLDRVRAVETNWIACSDLEGVDEIGVPFTIETTPSDSGTSHFDPLPAFLIVDQTYLDLHYLS